MSIETITKRLKIISDLQEELNKARSVLESTLEDDQTYQKVQEETNKAKEEIKAKKEKVMAQQSVKNFSEEIKKVRDEIKENKEILAAELADYYRDSGSLQIVDDKGDTKRIIFSAKLVNS